MHLENFPNRLSPTVFFEQAKKENHGFNGLTPATDAKQRPGFQIGEEGRSYLPLSVNIRFIRGQIFSFKHLEFGGEIDCLYSALSFIPVLPWKNHL